MWARQGMGQGKGKGREGHVARAGHGGELGGMAAGMAQRRARKEGQGRHRQAPPLLLPCGASSAPSRERAARECARETDPI